MSESEADALRRLREAGVCPNCGNEIPKGQAVVRGTGSFCGLDCIALYFQAEFSERARRLAVALRN